MRTLNKNTWGAIVLLFVMGLFVGCQSDDSNDISNSGSDFVALERSADQANEEVEEVNDELDQMVDEVLDNEDDYFGQAILRKGPGSDEGNATEGKKPDGDKDGTRPRPKRDRYIPECTEITKSDKVDGERTVTIDFGDGCTLRNGHVLKGKIILVYKHDKDAAEKSVTQTFDGFYVDDKQITGTNIHVRKRANANGNREATTTVDIAINWADGAVGTREGTRSRELIEGAGDGDFSNNVYSITGNWEAVYKNGNTRTVEIVEALIRKMECRGKIVDGIKKITKGDRMLTIDYGDGSCDSPIIATNQDGESKEIKPRTGKRGNR